MRQAVHDAWHEFSEPLEGRVKYMYLDSAKPTGLVTVGVGNLIDPLSEALRLPFRHRDGSPATRSEITAVWLRVKGLEANKDKHISQRSDASLILTEDDIDALVASRIASNEVELRRFFPGWDEWPADAQLGIMSWCWAVGPRSPYPRMFAALRDGDFERSATEVTVTPERGTVMLRNERNRICLNNAARVVQHGLDPAELYWPRPLEAEFGAPEPPEAA